MLLKNWLVVENLQELTDRLLIALNESRAEREKFSELQALVRSNEALYRCFGEILRHPAAIQPAVLSSRDDVQDELSASWEASARYWDLGQNAFTRAKSDMAIAAERMKAIRKRTMGSLPETNPEHAWEARFGSDVRKKRKSSKKANKRPAA